MQIRPQYAPLLMLSRIEQDNVLGADRGGDGFLSKAALRDASRGSGRSRLSDLTQAQCLIEFATVEAYTASKL